jgi:hypothetical protein
MPRNERLYAELIKRFGEENVTVRREDEEATITLPPETTKTYSSKQTQRKWVDVEYWGEKYAVNCPVCGDTKSRLEMSYMIGQPVIPKGRKTIHYVKPFCYYCYNEGCDCTEFFRDLLNSCKQDLSEEELKNIIKPSTTKKYIKFTATEVELPKHISFSDSSVPKYVTDWIRERGFSPKTLETDFGVKFIPKGTSYIKNKKGEKGEFYQDRLLIPVINQRTVIGWQTRKVDTKDDKPTDKKFKYINSATCLHDHLYNFDTALKYDDIVIVEGVTDVWRVGKNAISLFGKTASKTQLFKMKTVWSFMGRAVVCLDPDADKDAIKLVEKLRKEKVFSEGVALLQLDKTIDKDPADYDEKELKSMIGDTFSRCTNILGGRIYDSNEPAFLQF